MKAAFARTLTRKALEDPNIILLTGDFCYGMFDELKAKSPGQYLNCGVCEQSMVGFAAGLAIQGFIPVVYTITPFLIERAFEQIKLDVDEQNLRVILVGFADYPKDGPTHRALSPRTMVGLLSKTHYSAPATVTGTEEAFLAACVRKGPTFISLRNSTPDVPREWPAEGRDA